MKYCHLSGFSTSATSGLYALLRTPLQDNAAQQWDGPHDPGGPDGSHGKQRGVPHLPHFNERYHRWRSGMFSSSKLLTRQHPGWLYTDRYVMLSLLTQLLFIYFLRCIEQSAGGWLPCQPRCTGCCTCTRDSPGPRKQRSEVWSGSLWTTQPKSCSSSWALQVQTVATRSNSKSWNEKWLPLPSLQGQRSHLFITRCHLLFVLLTN